MREHYVFHEGEHSIYFLSVPQFDKMYISSGENENVVVEVIRGDVDLDGVVSSSDAALALREYGARSGGEDTTFTIDYNRQMAAADMDDDGKITAADASLILREYTLISSGQKEPEVVTKIVSNNSSVDVMNTWTSWKAVPTERPSIELPEKKTNFIDVPGWMGGIDLSEVLTNYPIFNNRSGSIEFMVVPDYKGTWAQLERNINQYLHGRKRYMVLADDPEYYYEGTFSVSSLGSSDNYAELSIDYDLYPYKRRVMATDEPYLWDSFNLQNGIVRDQDFIKVSVNTGDGNKEPVINFVKAVYDSKGNSRGLYFDEVNFPLLGFEPSYPTITVISGSLTFYYTNSNEKKYNVAKTISATVRDGETIPRIAELSDWVCYTKTLQDDVRIDVSGTGTYTFHFRIGVL